MNTRLSLTLILLATAGLPCHLPAAGPARQAGKVPTTEAEWRRLERSHPDYAKWPELTAEQRAAAIEESRAFVTDAATKLNVKFLTHETPHFLIYSDMARDDLTRAGTASENMYANLCKVFGLDRDANIWHGKAVVIVFAKKDDFVLCEKQVFDNDATGWGGFCHLRGSHVYVCAYQHNGRFNFLSTMAHEATHGFLFRYKNKKHVASWANEGLAEVASDELTAQGDSWRRARDRARKRLATNPLTDAFFSSERIVAEEYPVAQTFTRHLINLDREKYVRFIDGIKDGKDPVQSLEQSYGLSRADLLESYTKWIMPAGPQAKRPDRRG